jgi:hypothetical protein
MLLQLLRDENTQERKDVLSPSTLDLIMRYAFTTNEKTADEVPSSNQTTLPDLVKVELLKVLFFQLLVI